MWNSIEPECKFDLKFRFLIYKIRIDIIFSFTFFVNRTDGHFEYVEINKTNVDDFKADLKTASQVYTIAHGYTDRPAFEANDSKKKLLFIISSVR